MDKLYFLVGSQDLYGDECLRQVAEDARRMTAFFNEKLGGKVEVVLLPTVVDAPTCVQDIRKANVDDDCIGIMTWMHTFSPAKMWIRGLQELCKPLLHLHTQANELLPYVENELADALRIFEETRDSVKASGYDLRPEGMNAITVYIIRTDLQ